MEDYYTKGTVLSPSQYQGMFDRNMSRFVERMNYNGTEKYGAWTYDDLVLADGADRHYIKRLGSYVMNQDGEMAGCDEVDYTCLAKSIKNREFYNGEYRFVCVPLKNGNELVCFGLGGGAE